jgi:hypothetical protein
VGPSEGISKECWDWVWWCLSVIPAFGTLEQEDQEFEVSLGYLVRFCLKKRKITKKLKAKERKGNGSICVVTPTDFLVGQMWR